jgi:hypothetical protein
MKIWLARSTVFAAFFAITAFILALKGLLTSQYVGVITALHVSIVARAVAEDYHERCTDKKDEGAPKS